MVLAPRLSRSISNSVSNFMYGVGILIALFVIVAVIAVVLGPIIETFAPIFGIGLIIAGSVFAVKRGQAVMVIGGIALYDASWFSPYDVAYTAAFGGLAIGLWFWGIFRALDYKPAE